jgi:hypothetical protein
MGGFQHLKNFIQSELQAYKALQQVEEAMDDGN